MWTQLKLTWRHYHCSTTFDIDLTKTNRSGSDTKVPHGKEPESKVHQKREVTHTKTSKSWPTDANINDRKNLFSLQWTITTGFLMHTTNLQTETTSRRKGSNKKEEKTEPIVVAGYRWLSDSGAVLKVLSWGTYKGSTQSLSIWTQEETTYKAS